MFAKLASKYDVERDNFTLFFNFILPLLATLAAILATNNLLNTHSKPRYDGLVQSGLCGGSEDSAPH